MKILNLIQCTNLGGMEQASLRLMRGLKERGHNLQLLSLNPVGRLGPLLQEAGIPHEGLPYLGKGGWRSYGLLKRKLKNIQADAMIMTGHHLLASMALGDSFQGHRIMAIHYHHTGVKSLWEWRLIYRIACRRFNAITFPCDFIRKEAEIIHPPVARLAHTVRNPLDVPALPTTLEKVEARKKLNLPLDRPIVGNAGWLIQRKRFDVFLRVARKVLDKNPDVLFAIAGSGEEEQNLKKLADELGIAASVRWLGWVQDISNFHKSLDVLLFNSDWDAVGLTPLEAMSYGVPAVCSVVHGGLGEILDSSEVGFLLPSHDIGALAERILYLLGHRTEAGHIGLAGRQHVETACNTAPIVDWHVRALAGKIPPSVQARKSEHPELPGKSRTALLFHRVGPYHFARAQAAGAIINTRLIEVFKSDDVYGWDPVPGANGFERVSLFENNSQSSGKLIEGVEKALEDYQPQAITIPGWADAVAFTAIRWGVDHGVPVIVMSETTEWDEPRVVLKEWIKRRILRMCSAGLVGGQPHAEYLSRLGLARDRVFQGYDAVDNEYFARNAKEAISRKEEIRKKHGLPENYFLASARFVDKKNLLNLVRAYGQYRESVKKEGRQPSEIWHLVLLGDGPLKSEISNLVASLGLQQYVLMPGFKQYHELPEFYALAKVFIHASTVEQWGLVVNEAMASGLPVLVSNRCGCARNMVQEGVNGYMFDPYDPKQMAEMMSRMSGPGFLLADFGSASSRIIAEWGPNRFARGLSQAIKAASDAPRVTMGTFDRLLLHLLSRK